MSSNDKKFDKVNDTISIDKFVCNYLGAYDVDCRKLRHVGLKSFGNPYVVGVSNEFARKNPEYVKTGKILLVLDYRGDLGSYINPELLRKLTDTEAIEDTKRILQSARIYNLGELSEYFAKMSVLFKNLETIETYQQLISDVGKEDVVENIKKMRKYLG